MSLLWLNHKILKPTVSYKHQSKGMMWSLLLLLSCFSRVRLYATPWTAAHQAPLSLGFSRQERWSGLPFPSPMHESEKWKWSPSVMSDSQRPHGLQPTRLLHPWDFPGKSTGVGCHCLLWAEVPRLQIKTESKSKFVTCWELKFLNKITFQICWCSPTGSEIPQSNATLCTLDCSEIVNCCNTISRVRFIPIFGNGAGRGVSGSFIRVIVSCLSSVYRNIMIS